MCAHWVLLFLGDSAEGPKTTSVFGATLVLVKFLQKMIKSLMHSLSMLNMKASSQF